MIFFDDTNQSDYLVRNADGVIISCVGDVPSGGSRILIRPKSILNDTYLMVRAINAAIYEWRVNAGFETLCITVKRIAVNFARRVHTGCGFIKKTWCASQPHKIFALRL